MSCQCYQIGGPFISFDPDCPAHGLEAQAREQQLIEQGQQITDLEQTVAQLRDELARLRQGER